MQLLDRLIMKFVSTTWNNLGDTHLGRRKGSQLVPSQRVQHLDRLIKVVMKFTSDLELPWSSEDIPQQ